jgi:hypothetical protein
MTPYNHKMGQKIKTDVPRVTCDMAFPAHFHVAAADAKAAVTNGIHAAVPCSTPAQGSSATVKAATAITDILTVSSTIALGVASNDLKILLTTAANDTLAVTKTDGTKTINVALADSSAAKNTAALIQAAIRALSTVGGVSVSGITCAAGGNWDSAAIATGEADVVSFSGGQVAASDVVTTGFTQPSVPCNITATAGGTAGDIKAVQVIVEGERAGVEITETLPAFTVNTQGTVTGSKAFDKINRVTIPAHDGAGATTAIGFGEALGLPYKLPHNTVLFACLNDVREATAPTVTTSLTALESNTIDLNSALDGHAVDAYLLV